jgi:hypothetical protein
MNNKTNIILDIFIYSISAGIIAYLIYSLILLKNELNYLHVILIVLGVGLLLSKKADKLKILNILEFNSKLDDIKRENKKEFEELKTQIQNVSINFVPKQWLTNIITTGQSTSELSEAIHEAHSKTIDLLSEKEKRIKDDTKTQDIVHLEKRVEMIYNWSYYLLFLTRTLQIAILKNRMFKPKDVAIDMGIKSFEERTTYLLRQILDSDLRKMFPIVLVGDEDKEDKEKPFPIDKIIEGLELIEYVVELRKKMKEGSFSKNEIEEAGKKIDILHDALYELELLIAYRCNFALLYENDMRRKIKALSGEIKAAEEEKREIKFPPEMDSKKK